MSDSSLEFLKIENMQLKARHNYCEATCTKFVVELVNSKLHNEVKGKLGHMVQISCLL